MKRLILLLVSASLFLTACGSDDATTEAEEVEEQEQEQVSVSISEDSVSFTNFTIEFEDAEVEDGVLYLETRYHNDSYPNEKSFMASARLVPVQNGEELEEISGVTTNPKSNYYYKNDTGINAPVKFEYELQNEEDDIVLQVIPQDFENEETIELNITFE